MRNVITVAQQKGGCGKSTIACHIAILAEKKGEVALIDCDPQGTLSRWYEARLKHDNGKFATFTFVKTPGWKLHKEIQSLQSDHKFIIIDCPPHIEADTMTAMREANLVLVPVQPSPADFWSTELFLNMAMNEKLNVKLCMNRVLPSAKIVQTYRQKFPFLLKNSLGNRVAFAQAMQEGFTATETAPRSLAASEMHAVFGEIIKALF